MRETRSGNKNRGRKGLIPATRPSEKESYLDKGSVQSRVEHPARSFFLEIGITIPALDEAEASGLDGNQVTQCSLGIVPDGVVQEGDGASSTESQRVAVVVLQTLVKFEPGDGHVLRVIHGAARQRSTACSSDGQFVLDIKPFGKEVGDAVIRSTQGEDEAGPVFESLPFGMDWGPGRKCLTRETESGRRRICGLHYHW